jgi:capsular exopolysaccharide synthesis family protein
MAPPIVKRYLIAFAKYKWIGLASSALVVAGSTMVAIQPDPPASYLGDAALTYSGPPISFSTLGSEIQQKGQAISEADLLAEPIIIAVAEKIRIPPQQVVLQLKIDIPSAVAATPPRPGAAAPSSSVIELKFQDSDRKRAAEALTAFMEAAIKFSGDRNTGQLKSIIAKINERVPLVKKELEAAEKKLEAYDRVERPAILAAENGSLLNAVTSSQNQQRQIQQTLSGIDAQIRSLQNKLGLSVNEAYVSSALSADPIMAQLRSQIYQIDAQMEPLKRDLRPEHPTMIQFQRQKDAAEKLLYERASEITSGGGNTAPLPSTVSGVRARSNLDPARQELANQLVSLQTQRETLAQQYASQVREEAKLRQEYSIIPNKQLERSRLEQNITLRKAVFDQMQIKLTDAKTAEAETVSSLGIARLPRITESLKPPKSVPVTIGAGIFFGMVVGGGVVFLLGSLEGTFKTQEDIRNSLKQREVALLGEFPLMPVDDLEPDMIPVLLSPESPYLEFYEKCRSNLRRIGGRNFKVVLITSTGSAEGKTTCAYNLGIASARAGKRTLVIETDLRSPSRCKSLNVSIEPDASIEPLRYYGSFSECIRLVPDIENLYIVPSIGPVRQSAAIIESSEMRRLFEDARERFDLVILDANPLGLSNDALLIQPYSDGIILVGRPNYTQESIFGEAIDQLVESEMGLIGGIINGTDVIVAPTTTPESKIPDEELDQKVKV